MRIQRTGWLSVITVPSANKKVGQHKKVLNAKHYWNVRRSKFACMGRHKVQIEHDFGKGKGHERIWIPLPLWIRPVSKKVSP